MPGPLATLLLNGAVPQSAQAGRATQAFHSLFLSGEQACEEEGVGRENKLSSCRDKEPGKGRPHGTVTPSFSKTQAKGPSSLTC